MNDTSDSDFELLDERSEHLEESSENLEITEPLKIVSISPEHKIDSPKEAQSEIKDENMSNDLVKQMRESVIEEVTKLRQEYERSRVRDETTIEVLRDLLKEKEATIERIQHDHEETIRRIVQSHEETIRCVTITALNRKT